MMASKQRPASDQARWIPAIFIAGMALVVAVNGVMVWLALSSWSGLAVPAPYQRGLDYNRVLAAVAEQESLGWAIAATFSTTRRGESSGAVIVTIRDRDGQPLSDLNLSGRLVRPLAEAGDIPLELRPAGAGRYAAAVSAPRPGQWELRLVARQARLAHQSSHRLSVP